MEIIKDFFAAGFAIVVIVVLILIVIDAPIKIKSDKPVIPELSITVKDGKVDTIWIYVEPKK